MTMPQSDITHGASNEADQARVAEHEALLGVLAHELRTPITTIYAGARSSHGTPTSCRRCAAN